MRTKYKEVLLNIGFSALIGLLVACTEIILPIYNEQIAITLITGALIGIIIGTISRYGCQYILKRNLKSMHYAYAFVFITIAVLVIISAIVLNYISGTPIWTTKLIYMMMVAEMLGLTLAYFSIKYYTSLNDSLIMKKNQVFRNR